MAEISDLQNRFGIDSVVRFGRGQGGLTCIDIAAPAGEGRVYLHGAHVTHYQRRGGKPLLFMSGASWFEAGKPIRGGVPICFPWFGPRAEDPKAPAHGFARLQEWAVESVKAGKDGSVSVMLGLEATAGTRALWPHEFELRYTVTVGARLGLALEVRNPSDRPLRLEEALHTYLAVADVRQVSIDGLAGVTYLDKVQAIQRKVQGAEPIRITGETDRVYLNTRGPCAADDPAGGRRIVVAKEGSEATVVWNPWIAKAKAMVDFGDDEWPGMLCIETCNVGECAVTVAPVQAHVMRARIEG